VRPIHRGEVLIEVGDRAIPFFVVTAGGVEVVRPSAGGEVLVVTHGPGGFTGEAALLAGRPSIAQARVSEPGEVIELDRETLLSLMRTDVELGEILLRVFILRRLELVARGIGDTVLLGSVHCAGTCA
jgi:thioredoxin reductase (NADPH)